MANFFTDNKDLQFYVEKGIDWEPLVRLTEYNFKAEDGFENGEDAKETYRDILDMVGKFAATEIAPNSKIIDEVGVQFKDGKVLFPEELNLIFGQLSDLGLHALCVPRELGGVNCPLLIYYLNAEMIARADVSTMTHHSFHGGIAMCMLMYSSMEGSTTFQADPPRIVYTRFQKEIEEIMSGAAWGSMDITESNAGSDMGALRCIGEQDDKGNWSVSGEKIFITSGHAKYHFVIAKTEKSNSADSFEALKQLSLFLVQSYTEDDSGEKLWFSSVDRIEEKLGHHGSATVTMSFDRTPAQIIGERGTGFKQMLVLMNNARIGVGFESLGLCEAAYRMALEYAEERPSMGKTISQHEMIADYLDEMKTDIQGIRALAIYGAYHEEMAQKLKLLLESDLPKESPENIKERQKYHQARSREVTPLIKYFAAEKSVELSQRNLQIHGGVGYTKEYGAEKLLRDSLVLPIYEGTSQIQALMAMKDTLMVALKKPSAFVKESAKATHKSFTGKNPLLRRVAKIQARCYGAVQALIKEIAIAKFKTLRGVPARKWLHTLKGDWDPKRDFAPAMLHAERLTRMLVDRRICEILYEQTLQHPEREEVLIRFLERAEYRSEYLFKVITRTGGRILDNLKLADE